MPLTESADIMRAFQLEKLTVEQKSQTSVGLAMAKEIDSYANFGVGNGYFFNRNARFTTNRAYANGKISMQRFMDQLDFNGKFNFANINWQCIKIVNRIVSGLVGAWMQRNERVIVKAIDTLSMTQKNDEYAQMEFVIANRRKLEQLQQQSGVQLIPQDPIPANQDQLKLWQAHIQKLPEEILNEIGINEAYSANGLFDVIKDQLLHDSAVTGFVGTYTWMDEQGVVHIDRVQPENAIYSYTKFNDFRDTKWRGQIKSMRMSDMRVKYGVEYGGTLTEEELFKIAATSKNYQLYDQMNWNNNWNLSLIRPYDEWNVDIVDFEIKSPNTDGYIVKKTRKSGSTILRRGDRKEMLKDNEEYLEDKKWSIYRGVFVRVTQTLLEWGVKENMIRPQDPKETGDCEFSYSFYMYQNYDMYNVALPEKIQEPVDQMIIARLKVQQLVANMAPAGVAINWRAVQNMDYGLGDKNKEVDSIKLRNQTGNFYYRDQDAEGNPIGLPFTEVNNAGFLPQLQGLILIYDKHFQILKDELGEDPNLVSQALQPRVTSGNVDVAQRTSDNATGYMYDAVMNLYKDTARKVACLIKTSVLFGSKVYRELMSKEQIEDKIFSADIELMPTEMELAKFEAFINQGIAANPQLIAYLDPMQLMDIAKNNLKLAQMFFRNAQEKMYVGEMQKAQANSEQQAQVQAQTMQASELEKRKTKEMEGQVEVLKATTTADGQSKNTVLTGIMNMYVESMKSGSQLPPEMKILAQMVLQNVALPVMIENKELQQEISQQVQGAMQPRPMQAPEPEMANEQQEEPQPVAA